MRGEARVSGKLVCEAELTFVFTQVSHPAILQRRKEALNIWLYGSAESAT